MTKSLRSTTVVALGSLLMLAACGADEAGPKKLAGSPVQVEGPGAAVGVGSVSDAGAAGSSDELDMEETAGGGGGGFSGGRADADGSILAFEAMLVEGDSVWGEPIEVALRIKNTSTWPVRLTPLANHPLGAMKLDIHGVDDCTVTIPFRGDTSLATVEPQESLLAKVDVYPFLRDMRSYDDGQVRFTLRYGGVVRVGGGEDDDELARSLVSEQFSVDISPPAWLEDIGFEREAYDEVMSLLKSWDPDGRNAKSPAPAISRLGEPGVAALCWAMERLASGHPDLSRVGGRAMLVAREIGAPVQAVLRRAADKPNPARSMALGILADDVRAAKQLPPPPEAEPFRAIAGGKRGASLELMFSSTRNGNSIHVKVDRDGILSVTRNGRHAAAPLDTESLVELKRATLEACPWRWLPVRRTPRGDEGRMSLVLTQSNGAKTHVSMHRIEGTRDNPFSAALLKAFTAKAAEIEETVAVSKQAQSTSAPR